jgi:hypothetical protein
MGLTEREDRGKDCELKCAALGLVLRWCRLSKWLKLTVIFHTRTGMKVLPASKVPLAKGLVLHDCHAEVKSFYELWFFSIFFLTFRSHSDSYTGFQLVRLEKAKDIIYLQQSLTK